MDNKYQRQQGRRLGRPPNKPRKILKDGKTYVSLNHAAQLAGLAHSAFYRWIEREGKRGTALDLIVDAVAQQRFIPEPCLETLIQSRYQPSTPEPAKHDETIAHDLEVLSD